MKVTVEKLPASQVSFEIEVEGAKSQAIYDRTLKQLSQSINVPGFRKGKAPRELMLRQIGKEKLKANVLEELIQTTLTEVVKTYTDIQAIGSFDLGTSLEDLFTKFTVGAPIQFTAAIDVHPVIHLNQYQNLSVQAEQVDPDLTQVDKTLHEYQVKRATVVPVERAIEMEDLVTIDFRILDTAGELIKDANETDFQITMNKDDFLPEVIENLVGMNLGETKEIAVTLPDNFFVEEFKSQPANFIATVTDLKYRELPALDDEFAKAISAKETISELRTYLEERIIEDATTAAETNINKALINAVVEQMVEIQLPATMIDRESERLVQQQIEWLTQTPEGEKLAKQIVNKEFVQDLIVSNQPEAIDRIKKSLAIAEIARREEITAPRLEAIDAATKLYQEIDDKSVDFELIKQVSEDEIIVTKVMEWLKANSSIEIVPAGTLQPLEIAGNEAELEDQLAGDRVIETEAVEVLLDDANDTDVNDLDRVEDNNVM
jgi:trigger factor